MLDQRRAEEKGFITLKEAAKLANYTPDYVGQLIRAGKIKGEQVYSQTAWVTTPEEVRAYLSDKNRIVSTRQTFGGILKDLSSFTIYFVIGVVSVALLVLQYVLFVSLDARFEKAYVSPNTTITLSL